MYLPLSKHFQNSCSHFFPNGGLADNPGLFHPYFPIKHYPMNIRDRKKTPFSFFFERCRRNFPPLFLSSLDEIFPPFSLSQLRHTITAENGKKERKHFQPKKNVFVKKSGLPFNQVKWKADFYAKKASGLFGEKVQFGCYGW